MMIAMLVGLIVSAGVIAIFVSNVKSSSENVRMIRLNQELRGVMSFISDELKRAGYSGDPAISGTDFIDDANWDAASSCLRYSYDEDNDGIQQADERFGFKLLVDEIHWGTNQVDDLTDCTQGNWQAISDNNIATINTFTAPKTEVVASATVNVNQVIVTLTGQIALQPGTASRTITEMIRVRNDDGT